MSQPNPFQIILNTYESLSNSVQTHLSNLFPLSKSSTPSPTAMPSSSSPPLVIVSRPHRTSQDASQSFSDPDTVPSPAEEKKTVPLSKEVVGRATWTFLHAVAAQFPDKPSRQQKKDVKELMAIISRVYPCKDCSHHFQELLKSNPVQAGSHAEFSQWLCHIHNVVNRSLGKVRFPCERVDARWGKLDCPEKVCDVEGTPGIS